MIKFIGKINRDQVNELYGSARVGICIYQAAKNHFEAQPTKIFEFMAAGLPVVASNFPLWKKIVEGNWCGICVCPSNADEVRHACETLINDSKMAEKMGSNGRKAALQFYSWNSEQIKLLLLYSEINI